MAKKTIHFSDGSKIACGADTDSEAVLDPQDVTCLKCQAVIDAEAQANNDPIVRCTIYNQDLREGQDFNFNYEGTAYHGVSGSIHRIPKSVADHLASLAVPQKAYKEGQESGASIVEAGTRNRFLVNILEVMGKTGKAEKPIDPPATPPEFKVGDKVSAVFEGGDEYDGKIVGKKGDKFKVDFPDGDSDMFEESELTLI